MRKATAISYPSRQRLKLRRGKIIPLLRRSMRLLNHHVTTCWRQNQEGGLLTLTPLDVSWLYISHAAPFIWLNVFSLFLPAIIICLIAYTSEEYLFSNEAVDSLMSWLLPQGH